MTKIQKVRTLEHNDTDPSGWKQALAYQLIPYALEWLLDSNIPRPHKSHTSFGRWKYWSRLVASWMYNQIDVTLQNKLRNLSKMPKYADQLYDELMSMTQGSDRMQTAFIEMRKFDKMKRSDYNSASEYIEEYQRQYHVLARFKAAPHPSHGLSQVLQNIELEVMKVQFIREEVASLEPKKLTLDKVEEYWRALQAAADMEGVANATYNNNAGRGRGNGRGGLGGNRGGRGGHNNNGHNDDNTQSNKDTNAVEDDTATAKKKKKKGLRKQPADGKDIHEYAKEMRNGTQKDDNNMMQPAIA
ncbi:putative transposable element [Penicillium digitatum]|uniref:Putative transposable element n=1 Tax=Penicillium digitatum TaxID=36651 RepID=A0A7T6XVY3_PENDI|nr:putative transposable element [Penicillium digitatum]